jgi:hypothetical protein
MVWFKWVLPLHQQIKITAMNTDNTLAFISTMISSESSYRALVDMINEMDLEVMGVSAA